MLPKLKCPTMQGRGRKPAGCGSLLLVLVGLMSSTIMLPLTGATNLDHAVFQSAPFLLPSVKTACPVLSTSRISGWLHSAMPSSHGRCALFTFVPRQAQPSQEMSYCSAMLTILWTKLSPWALSGQVLSPWHAVPEPQQYWPNSVKMTGPTVLSAKARRIALTRECSSPWAPPEYGWMFHKTLLG
jgi:hypothetical protein